MLQQKHKVISGTRSMHVVCNVAPIQSVTQFVGEEGKREREGERQGKAAYSVRSPDHASLACVSLSLSLSLAQHWELLIEVV